MIDLLEPRRLCAASASGPVSLRVNAGAADVFVDASARTFLPDAGTFTGGRNVHDAAGGDVPGTVDDALFRDARVGADFSFRAAVANGRYALFVEFADGTSTAAGQRRFDVTAEGSLIADDLDPFARAATMATEPLPGTSAFAVAREITINDGALDLTFHADVGEAFVNAIVLVPTDAPAVATPYTAANVDESARVVISASQLRNLDIGVQLFANDHRGRFPATLAELAGGAGGEYAGFDNFANPRSDTRLPRGELSAIERTAWAAACDDYVYLLGGRPYRDTTATTPAAYENPRRVDGVINVAFVDGHVETLARATAAALLGFDAGILPTGAAGPALGLAKDPRVVQSQANMLAIDHALQTYANDHRGRLPIDLGTLVATGYIAPANVAVFANPRLGLSAMPLPPTGSTADLAGAWVNGRSDYVLLKGGVRASSVGSLDALLHERPAAADGTPLTGGLNVTLGYGATSFREFAWAYETLAPQSPPLAIVAAFDADALAVRVRFSEDVAAGLSADDLQVRNVDTGAPLAATGVTYDRRTQTATFRLASATPDGRYVATVAAGSVADAAGNALVSAPAIRFRVLAGDADGDGVVGFGDLLIVAQHYGQAGRSFAEGNLDRSADGLVGFDDLLLLAQRYGLGVPAVTVLPVAAKSKRAAR